MEVALGLQRDVDHGMAGKLLDHVVEEPHPGRDLVGAGPVEIDGRGDLGLLGPALDGAPVPASLFRFYAVSLAQGP